MPCPELWLGLPLASKALPGSRRGLGPQTRDQLRLQAHSPEVLARPISGQNLSPSVPQFLCLCNGNTAHTAAPHGGQTLVTRSHQARPPQVLRALPAHRVEPPHPELTQEPGAPDPRAPPSSSASAARQTRQRSREDRSCQGSLGRTWALEPPARQRRPGPEACFPRVAAQFT